MNATGSTARQTVTAMFDSRAAAQKAIDDLVGAGISQERIRLVEGGPEPVETQAEPSQDKGFWANLTDLFMPEEDRHSYGEGLRRGGFLLAVRSDSPSHERILDILDREGSVDMSEREADWELEGWKPARALRDLASRPARSGGDEAAWMGEGKPAARNVDADPEEIVPREDLAESYRGSTDVPFATEPDEIPQDEATPGRVGRRDPNAGRSRVRSYLDEGL